MPAAGFKAGPAFSRALTPAGGGKCIQERTEGGE